jgi:hypothetical protein
VVKQSYLILDLIFKLREFSNNLKTQYSHKRLKISNLALHHNIHLNNIMMMKKRRMMMMMRRMKMMMMMTTKKMKMMTMKKMKMMMMMTKKMKMMTMKKMKMMTMKKMKMMMKMMKNEQFIADFFFVNYALKALFLKFNSIFLF